MQRVLCILAFDNGSKGRGPPTVMQHEEGSYAVTCRKAAQSAPVDAMQSKLPPPVVDLESFPGRDVRRRALYKAQEVDG